MRRLRALPWVVATGTMLLLAGCGAGGDAPSGAAPPGGQGRNPSVVSGGPPPVLTSIRMVNETRGWALGRGGGGPVVLRTADGGRRWVAASPLGLLPPPGPGTDAAGYFPGLQTGWVAASGAAQGKMTITVAHTTNGGRRWRSVRFPSDVWVGSLGIAFVDARHGWILATSDPALGLMEKAVYETRDGGATWRLATCTCRRTPAGALPAAGYPTGMAFRDAAHGWVAELYRDVTAVPLYRTADGGRTWTLQALPVPDPYRVAFYANAYPPVFSGPGNRHGVFLVQFVGQGMVAVDAYVTRDGGANWEDTSAITVDASPASLAYFFADARHGWVLGRSGRLLYRTDDGGRHWKTMSLTPPLGGAGSRVQLDFVSGRVGWALVRTGGASALWKTRDGGRIWRQIP